MKYKHYKGLLLKIIVLSSVCEDRTSVDKMEVGLRKSLGSLVTRLMVGVGCVGGGGGMREECVMNPDQLSRDQINRNYNIPRSGSVIEELRGIGYWD